MQIIIKKNREIKIPILFFYIPIESQSNQYDASPVGPLYEIDDVDLDKYPNPFRNTEFAAFPFVDEIEFIAIYIDLNNIL